MKNGRIAGTGSYVPETIWKNEDLEKMVETSDAWIRERTGIGARHIAGEETVAQMAVKAARRALENAGICSTELDLILVGTPRRRASFRIPPVLCRMKSVPSVPPVSMSAPPAPDFLRCMSWASCISGAARQKRAADRRGCPEPPGGLE